MSLGMRNAAIAAPHAETRFVAYVAESDGDVRDAQRLRYAVYRESLGIAADADELDADRFDPFCDHLLVRDTLTSEVVGTYRILSADAARSAGGFYSETEFDLTRILDASTRLAEVGRACVHPAYRGGAVIALLLGALARHLVAREFEHVIGCASVCATRDPAGAAEICRRLVETRLAPPEWRVVPREPFRTTAAAPRDGRPALPPLIKGYVRLGAYVCGEAAWDEAFGTADLLLMLPIAAMDRRYRQRLLRGAA